MLQFHRPRNQAQGALATLELIFHSGVRNARKSHGNAVIGLLTNIFQTLLLVMVFYFMFELLDLRRSAIRGDFLLYVFSGIFLFMTHIKAVSAVSAAEGPTSAMMKHAPMNTIIAIAGAALSALYLQAISAGLVLFIYHAAFQPIELHDPVGTVAMFLLAWASGVAVGMVFYAMRPWFPEVAPLLSQIYQRVNMIASGKMFVANMLPGYILRIFDWNPLFHIIDQARGAMFLNYFPRFTSVEYALVVAGVCFVLALMGEFYTRKHASASWMAGK